MIELLLQADRLLTVDMVDPADAIYRKVAEADPHNAIAVVGMARCALARGDDHEAYRLAARALRIDPQNDMARRMEARLDEVLRTRGEVPGVEPTMAATPSATPAPGGTPAATGGPRPPSRWPAPPPHPHPPAPTPVVAPLVAPVPEPAPSPAATPAPAPAAAPSAPPSAATPATPATQARRGLLDRLRGR